MSFEERGVGALVAPIQNDAELRAMLIQVHEGALWQMWRIEYMSRTPLGDVMRQLDTELADTN